MQIRVKGLKINTCMNTGVMSLGYHYPIKREFYNVFKAVEELLGVNVVEIKRDKNNRDVYNYYCYFFTSGNSNECITKFRKVQTELMMLSRRAKIEQMNQDLISLQGLKEFYNK